MRTHLSLFSGIGGMDLAAHWAGWETVALCEINPFCQRILKRHWPGVPIFPDVKELNGTVLRSFGIHQVDLITGGYPCQPWSYAGERQGEKDPRHLWPHFRRLIGELRPRWILGENVSGHLDHGIDQVLLDLDRLGYDWRPFVFPADAVGSGQGRERVFIVACAAGLGWEEALPGGAAQGRRAHPDQCCALPGQPGPAASQPGMGGDANGISGWLDRSQRPRVAPPEAEQFPWEPSRTIGSSVKARGFRIEALGNAVDPYMVFPLLKAIANH
jgi:DNA (cytosine-5)-methyltransferase 1